MVDKGDFVVIGISVGVAIGIFIASLVFFGLRWYKKRAHLQQCTNERSTTTLPIRTNGIDTSIDSSASISNSIAVKRSDYLAKNFQPFWWNHHSKDRFASASGIPRYTYKDIQKATENFTTILGQGSFGPVYKATMPAGGVAAVKVLASNSKQGEKEFQTEVSVLGRLHHRNLVNLVGYCVDKGQHMLIYEFMSNGSLANLLYSEEEQVLSWEERLQIALDISHGIEYLHDGAVPPVIHRDLKSANILLDQSMRAKVADFGLSKEQVFDGHNSGLKGTYGYIDPVYISTNKFTMKSDIYSFGIILFELITAIHPHQNLMEYVNLASMSPDGVDEILDKPLVGGCNLEEVRSLASIAHKCLHKTLRKRPSIGEVSQAILKIKQRRLAKEDTMSFAGQDYSRVMSRIECQQVELRQMASINERSPLYRRLWGPVRRLESLHPHANPRGNYAAPILQTNSFIFVRIRGGFHEIRNSICDVVVVARLLNATLVIPEIQSTTSSKGISSEFKSFAYLYNEDQFMVALAEDVRIVKTLPKNLKGARRKKEIPSFRVPQSASPYFYLHHVLPVLNKHSVVELVVSDGDCLQAILPPHLEEYQRLRCRVAFHALQFRQEVQELATKILNRLRAPGRPFIAYDPGMTRDALAYYGCAELFQDVHTELIQHRRSWMIKRGIVKGNLTVNSAEKHLNGSCPLMPEEVGILLRAYGYSWDTIIYVSGGEVFGGQKKLIPLHAMFENVVDRTSLSTAWELSNIYGREANLIDKYPRIPPSIKEKRKLKKWKTSGSRPRPLPPPPARPKYPYNIEGWWGWVAESDNEPESTVMELRTNAHKLLWEAIDYTIGVEADAFIPGFDRDGKGHPNFASLVMGHRLYQSAASKTYRLNRKEVAKLLEETRDHLYEANHTWITSVRRHLRKTLLDGLTEESTRSKPLSFLSHPVPECSCLRYDTIETSFHASSPLAHSQVQAALGVTHRCPAWMDNDTISQLRDKEREEDLDEEDSTSSGLFFRYSSGNHEGGGGEMNNKEEAQMEDQEELEGGER